MKTQGMGQGHLLLGVLATLKTQPNKPHYGLLFSPKEVCFAMYCTSFLHQHNSVVSCVLSAGPNRVCSTAFSDI